MGAAVVAGDVQRLLQLVGQHPRAVNAADAQGWRPLHYASNCESDAAAEAVVRVLLEAGAVTAVRGPSGLTPLHCALMARSDAAAAALLTAPDASAAATAIDDTGMQPLHAAARFGRTAVIPALLSAGAAANATSSSHGFTPLHFACASGHAGAVRALLEGGAAASLEAKDRDGDTPLLLAVRENHTECVDSLLQAGADADAVNQAGLSALFLAAQSDAGLPIVQALISAGAGLNEGAGGRGTALHAAAAYSAACCEALAAAGATLRLGAACLAASGWHGGRAAPAFNTPRHHALQALTLKPRRSPLALLQSSWPPSLGTPAAWRPC